MVTTTPNTDNSQRTSLNATEAEIVMMVSKARVQYCVKVGTGYTRYDDKTRVSAEMDYFGAEMAYCKIMGVYPDLTVGSMLPYDAVLPGGITVDVKQTSRPDGRLLVKSKPRDVLPNYYALMIGKFTGVGSEYRLVGHVLASKIIDESHLDKSLPYPAYALAQNMLVDDPIW